MKFDKGAKRDFLHVINEDAYHLRCFPVGYFTHVIDIGANIGAFSILARCLNPKAKILAVEPAKETYAMLSENTDLYEVDKLSVALGDGQPVSFFERTPDMSVRNVFLKEGIGGYSVESLTLSQIVKQAGIDEKSIYYLKIDCEGGERCLIDLSENDAIRKSACFAIELHYQGSQWDEWKDAMSGFLRPFEDYVAFLNATLKETHVPVKPMVKKSWGVSEHLFVHKKHIHAYSLLSGRSAFSFEAFGRKLCLIYSLTVKKDEATNKVKHFAKRVLRKLRSLLSP